MGSSTMQGVRRRQLLKGALGGGVLAAMSADLPPAAEAAPAPIPPAPPPPGGREFSLAADVPGLFVANPGSDSMVDVIKSLGIDYIAANPGSSFRGLHESIINYGRNSAPELLTCLHEETAVAIATGYAHAAGKPMAVMLHAAVGIQHGAMSIYNAFADCLPVLMFGGASLDAATRRPGVEWVHAAQDNAATVRDFTKWDDQPMSMQHFAESTVRAVKLATSVPMGPVLIMIDEDLQEQPFEKRASLAIPRLTPPSPPVADRAVIDTMADALMAAGNPVILAHRYARTDAGMPLLVELAELLRAPVVDSGDRFNFPTDHFLNHSQRLAPLMAQTDVILALEPVDLWGALNDLQDQNGRPTKSATRPDVRVLTIGVGDLFLKSNYQNFQRYVGVTMAGEGDAQASLPSLIAALRKRVTPAWEQKADTRAAGLKTRFDTLRARNREEAKFAWDASPISTARLCSEIWDVIRSEDWVLTNRTGSVSNWPQKLWPMNKPHQYAGSIGAGAVGASIGVATGIGLAYRGSGKIVVNIQNDGDLLYAPGALWTAVHHDIPMLNIVHNNRAYHQELMHIQRMANRRERGVDRARIGSEINDPPIDFAKLAAAMGMWSAGPITAPGDLSGALKRALAIVKQGRPALVEVVTQPR